MEQEGKPYNHPGEKWPSLGWGGVWSPCFNQ